MVESCVNYVGVDLNTACWALLGYVAGIGESLAKAIVRHRDAKGPFATRQGLLGMLEAHRLNSPYILEGKDKSFLDTLNSELAIAEKGIVDIKKLHRDAFEIRKQCVTARCRFCKKEIAGGRMRLPRALTAFIEAEGVTVAASGGVKNDAVDPSGDTAKGFGNVPFHRDEYCGSITAFFDLTSRLSAGFGLAQMSKRCSSPSHFSKSNVCCMTACVYGRHAIWKSLAN